MDSKSNNKKYLSQYFPRVPFLTFNEDEYGLSDWSQDIIFSRSVEEMFVRSTDEYGSNKNALVTNHGSGNYIDVKNEYHLNSYGYRSSEFKEGTDFIYAGCSYSFGEGSAEKNIWGTQVAKHFGYTYSNLSKPGASTQWIVKNLFNYFREYGNPKVVACLFPDFGRMIFPLNNHIMTMGDSDNMKEHVDIRDLQLSSWTTLSERPKYSKKPHLVRDVISNELPMMLAIQYITMLAQYCSSNDIKFVWSTWDTSATVYMKDFPAKYGYSEFIDIKNELWHDFEADDYLQYYHSESTLDEIIEECYDHRCTSTPCHEDLEKIYGRDFYIGSDVDYVGGASAHFGVHRHIHTAEEFIKRLQQ
jgi:hypothetical protein